MIKGFSGKRQALFIIVLLITVTLANTLSRCANKRPAAISLIINHVFLCTASLGGAFRSPTFPKFALPDRGLSFFHFLLFQPRLSLLRCTPGEGISHAHRCARARTQECVCRLIRVIAIVMGVTAGVFAEEMREK